MKVSIGIMAHNEEKNIARLLNAIKNQMLKKVDISEIIVVSSGSTDNTNQIVKKSRKAKLIIEKKRKGKTSAINLFLKEAKSKHLVLISADVIPRRDAIERLCTPLEKKTIGIVASRPVPAKENRLINKIVQTQWLLHHKISLKKPKYGEAIAFKNIIKKIKNTAADEEHIAMLIHRKGLKGCYAKDSIVYNKGPETISDFLSQRRRIHSGHIRLKKRTKYEATSMNNNIILKETMKIITKQNFFILIISAFLEIIGRTLGIIDTFFGKKHYIWKISKTTKEIS